MFEIYSGRKVLVTGHTGFCGSWLSRWLSRQGAELFGISLPPQTLPNLFDSFDCWNANNSFLFDLSTPGAAGGAVEKIQPEVIFHLAAQPLVRQSYRDTPETYRSNVIGTVEVLEAIRKTPSVRAAVMITTDKVYENNEDARAFAENDRLGGKDPYSASKAACELAISSYREAVLDADRVLCASARGGNIIGGGDWSADRLIPDIVRSLTSGETLKLRSPHSTRPWQHVLALCHGYLALGEKLLEEEREFANAWNFGPTDKSAPVTTAEVVEMFAEAWRMPAVEFENSPFHEANFLALDSSKAQGRLDWAPSWSVRQTVEKTALWYKQYYEGEHPINLVDADIEMYVQASGARR